MCEIKDARSVAVCDAALQRYRTVVQKEFGHAVSITHVDYEPTLFECVEASRVNDFRAVVEKLMHER